VTSHWLIVVLMSIMPSNQPNLPNTPAYIPYIQFETKKKCHEFVVENQQQLFFQAVKTYQGLFPPDRIICIDKDMFQKLFMNKNTKKEDI